MNTRIFQLFLHCSNRNILFRQKSKSLLTFYHKYRTPERTKAWYQQ